jgi:hypothetical protein
MNRAITTLLLFCAISFFAPRPASAAPITVPTDLNPGDQYRLSFVTSTKRDATSLNIADYNAFVTAVAASMPELAALGTTWTAIASTPTVDARDNTATNYLTDWGVPIYHLAGARVADHYHDLWDGTLDAALRIDESGVFLPGQDAWTGSRSDGSRYTDAELGEAQPMSGRYDLTFDQWCELAPQQSTLPLSLYAISAGLTLVPEPGTMLLGCLGAAALVGWQLRRGVHRKRL